MDKFTNFVFPMAGEGSRFKLGGIYTPKPLLKLSGRYFFEIAANALVKESGDHNLVFVVLQEHIHDFDIHKTILDVFPKAEIVALDETTSGSAETAYLGIQAAKLEIGSLIIADCDQWLKGSQLREMFEALNEEKIDIGLPVFSSENPEFSYVKRETDLRIIDIVEKDVISKKAVAGCYGFRSEALFNQVYESFVDWKGERYLSEIVSQGIKHDLKVYSFDLEAHVSFGTPADYASAQLSNDLLGALND